MRCEESFITIKSIWHSYLVFSLVNCAHKTRIAFGGEEKTRDNFFFKKR